MIGSSVKINDTDEVYPDQIGSEGTIVDVSEDELTLYRVFFDEDNTEDWFSIHDFDVQIHSTLGDTLADYMDELNELGLLEEIDLDL